MKSTARLADPAAITLSGLCLVHCLALPMLSVVLPVLGAWAEAEWVHLLVIALALPLALFALRGKAARPLLGLALAGLAAMVLAALHWPSHEAEIVLNTSGGLALAAAHGLHWRRRHGRVR